MRLKFLLGATALLMLVATITWRAPARIAANWLEQSGHPLRLQITQGTLWNGSARQTRWQGLLLGESHWQLRSLGFSPFSLNYDIEADSPQFRLTGQVQAFTDGSVQARELRGQMPARWVDLQSFIPLVFLAGHIEWQIETLDLPAAGIPRARGVFYWRQAGLTGLIRVNLGALEIRLQDSMEQISATIRSLESADLRIDGNIISDGVEYTLDARVSVNSQRQDIFDMLAGMGTVQPDGSIRLNWTGRLFPQ